MYLTNILETQMIFFHTNISDNSLYWFVIGLFLVVIIILLLLTLYLQGQVTKIKESRIKNFEIVKENKESNVSLQAIELDKRIKEVETLNEAMVNLMEDLQNSHELSLQNSKRLAEVNAELEAFSYSVSHDLRAPLRAITGFSHILDRRYKQELDEDGKKYIENIIEASIYMSQLIEDLLEYSKLGRKVIKLKPVSLNESIKFVINHLSDLIQKTGGIINLQDDFPDVLGDRTLITQVFHNLFQNGLIYQDENNTPELSVTWHYENRKSSEDQKKIVRVFVKDNGIGIPKDYQEKIFNVFQRLHTQEEYPGTGIGLSIVKKSIKLMSGELELISEVNKGSTFIVSLIVDQ
jgi:light-regulated signal transduction histidine kinase (bacteriophytochrome)